MNREATGMEPSGNEMDSSAVVLRVTVQQRNGTAQSCIAEQWHCTEPPAHAEQRHGKVTRSRAMAGFRSASQRQGVSRYGLALRRLWLAVQYRASAIDRRAKPSSSGASRDGAAQWWSVTTDGIGKATEGRSAWAVENAALRNGTARLGRAAAMNRSAQHRHRAGLLGEAKATACGIATDFSS